VAQRDFRIERTTRNQSDYSWLFYEVEKSFWGPSGTDADKADVALGTPGQRALFVMTLFARLVDNGGLMSFFQSAGFYSREVAEALTLLQFAEMQDVFAASLALVCKEAAAPEDEKAARAMLRNLSEGEIEKLDAITERLYAGSGVEERLLPYFKAYVDAHPQDFFKD